MKIKVKGAIIPNNDKYIYEHFNQESTCPSDIEKALDKAEGKDVTIKINSGGGDVFSGSEIYSLIKGYKGKVEVEIIGIAASAASVIAMSRSIVKVSPTAQLMIHNAYVTTQGDYRDMEHTAATLKEVNKSISKAYSRKTKKTQEELLSLMDNETRMSADSALEHRFIDEIMFESPIYSNDKGHLLPDSIVNTFKNDDIKYRNSLREVELLKIELLKRRN
ncbi:head maturation protease, ClpP-related [Erysipelothrix rhusiopathiae]|uniref:head maturation protease, ClpP-related n=1 Tax=Erysipelothrix rhusiopathiae TaxID=1648 RepID=UPI002B25398B|nr:head maturation protease, ClpP-related [Erysipelothrix rhusiopathiae]WRB93168.1 Clp protease ClpP [Erysipelothrix rhusiopathiae]